MEPITAEEQRKGSEPSRLEKIMMTPVAEVLAKDSWNDLDVEILIHNRHSLPADVLEKIGVTPAKPATPEEVMKQTEELKAAIPEAPVVPEAPEAPEAPEEAPAPTEEVEVVNEVVDNEDVK